MSLLKNNDGDYVNLAVHGAWSAWQAALSNVDYVNWQFSAEPRRGDSEDEQHPAREGLGND
jgi:hypothetical protein